MKKTILGLSFIVTTLTIANASASDADLEIKPNKNLTVYDMWVDDGNTNAKLCTIQKGQLKKDQLKPFACGSNFTIAGKIYYGRVSSGIYAYFILKQGDNELDSEEVKIGTQPAKPSPMSVPMKHID